MLAACSGIVATVTELVRLGANLGANDDVRSPESACMLFGRSIWQWLMCGDAAFGSSHHFHHMALPCVMQDGRTALMYAVRHRRPAVVAELVRLRADMNATDKVCLR